jgi:hypothetical protein
VNLLLAAGELTEEEAKNHPKKNILMNALGINDPIEIDIFDCNMEITDILLCSDGLTTMVTEEGIEKVLLEKYLPLSEKKKKYHIEDIIQLPKNVNPNAIYKKLDMDQRAYSEKFKNVTLYPACYEGLISCEYYLKMLMETDTLFSTNEFVTLQIDLYEANKNPEQNIESLIDINVMTPMGSKINKPMAHSNTTVNKEEIKKENIKKNQTFEQKDQNNNIIINENPDDNFNIINNNNIEIDKTDLTEGFDAPPSVINLENKNKDENNDNNNINNNN